MEYEDKVILAKELLLEVEKNNGHLMIAMKTGLTKQEVANLHTELLKELGEKTPLEVEQYD